MAIIEIDNLVKNYGRINALRGVSLSVERGEIFGLLGQNGAGKTTLIKILLGITRATSGSARMMDHPAGAAAVRRRVGYLPEDHRFPEYHTGASLLDFYGSLLEMDSDRWRRRHEVLDLVGLRERMHSKVRTYSKGMKQRLGIAQAIFHDPEIIFLDEPTDGVDPVGRREIRELLLKLKEQGKTIFVNSHLLGEVELVCDKVVILQRGQIIEQGSVKELTSEKGTYVVGLAPGQQLPVEELSQNGFTTRPAGELWEVQVPEGQTIDPVVDLIRDRNLSLRHLVEKRQSLEDLFVATVQNAEPGVDVRIQKIPGRDS